MVLSFPVCFLADKKVDIFQWKHTAIEMAAIAGIPNIRPIFRRNKFDRVADFSPNDARKITVLSTSIQGEKLVAKFVPCPVLDWVRFETNRFEVWPSIPGCPP